MRYDVLMFVALITALAATGVQALRQPQSQSETHRRIQQPIVIEPPPVTERVSLLERDFEYLSRGVKDLRDELRREMAEIKQLLKDQNDQTEKWIVFVLGLLVAGDRGWAILQRARNNKKEGKS